MNIQKWLDTTVLRSRTILSLLIGILALVCRFFGLDVDLGSVVDAADGLQLSELLAMLSMVAAWFFRVFLKTDLTTPGVGGAPRSN